MQLKENMFVYKDIIAAEKFHYLRNKENPKKVGLFLKGADPSEWEEVEMDMPIEVSASILSSVYGRYIHWQNSMFSILIGNDMSYDAIKTSIIKARYSTDMQIAIILNKDDSEEDLIAFNCMQDWRSFAKHLAQEIIKEL